MVKDLPVDKRGGLRQDRIAAKALVFDNFEHVILISFELCMNNICVIPTNRSS